MPPWNYYIGKNPRMQGQQDSKKNQNLLDLYVITLKACFTRVQVINCEDG
jgi:hypothetical protein